MKGQLELPSPGVAWAEDVISNTEKNEVFLNKNETYLLIMYLLLGPLYSLSSFVFIACEGHVSIHMFLKEKETASRFGYLIIWINQS